MEKEKPVAIYHHDYYGPLINSYSKSIFSSGLLLDEDLEVFLREYSFKTYPQKKKYISSYNLGIGIASALLSLYISKKYESLLLLIPAASIAAITVVVELNSINTRRHHNEIMDHLVNAVRNNHTLNGSIVRYIRNRVELGKRSDQQFFMQFNKSIEEFLKIMAKCEFSFFQVIMNNLGRIALYSNDLLQDFESFKNFDSISIIRESEVGDIVETLGFVKMVQDVHIWITSKLLSYLGIIFCSKTSKLDANNFDLFINIRIPHILSCLQHHHDYIKKQFLYMKMSASKLSEYKAKIIVVPQERISAKFRDTLMCSIDNISIIQEKAQILIEKIESDTTNGNIVIDGPLSDLRNHTRTAYESLELLCRLYGIMANSKKESHSKIPTSTTNDYIETVQPRVNYNDSVVTQEENFELYIDKDYSNENSECKEIYWEDQSKVYFSLMLRELKESLKKHDRFIEAKHRRGSKDEVVCETIKHQESIPKFNSNSLNKCNDIALSKNLLETEEDSPTEIKTPPTPPELPSSELNYLICTDSSHESMLEKIVALSSQRHVEEEVFSISDCSEFD